MSCPPAMRYGERMDSFAGRVGWHHYGWCAPALMGGAILALGSPAYAVPPLVTFTAEDGKGVIHLETTETAFRRQLGLVNRGDTNVKWKVKLESLVHEGGLDAPARVTPSSVDVRTGRMATVTLVASLTKPGTYTGRLRLESGRGAVVIRDVKVRLRRGLQWGVALVLLFSLPGMVASIHFILRRLPAERLRKKIKATREALADLANKADLKSPLDQVIADSVTAQLRDIQRRAADDSRAQTLGVELDLLLRKLKELLVGLPGARTVLASPPPSVLANLQTVEDVLMNPNATDAEINDARRRLHAVLLDGIRRNEGQSPPDKPTFSPAVDADSFAKPAWVAPGIHAAMAVVIPMSVWLWHDQFTGWDRWGHPAILSLATLLVHFLVWLSTKLWLARK